jgi:hypothetical protein
MAQAYFAGDSVKVPLYIPPFSLTAIILGGVGFYFWRRAILGVGSSSSQVGSRRLGAS